MLRVSRLQTHSGGRTAAYVQPVNPIRHLCHVVAAAPVVRRMEGLMPEPSSSAADVVISELPTDFTDNTEEAYITAAFAATDMDESERDSLSLPTIATIIYIIGVILSLIYSIFGLYQLCRIISDGERIKTGEYILIISNRDDIAPFSWLYFYVMNRNDYETAGDLIALHEMRHLKLRHWIDLVVVQVVSILQWFNPAAWLMGTSSRPFTNTRPTMPCYHPAST